jgi:RimJ/RimL family protein N-acetyltransferase
VTPPPSGGSGLPTLTTDRLELRGFDTARDLDTLEAFARDPETVRHLGSGTPWTRAETLDMIERHRAQYVGGVGFGAVVDRATGALAGWAGLQNPRRWMAKVVDPALPPSLIEVGWLLGPSWRGRGYATEAAAAWLDHGFRILRLGEIIAVHGPDNLASERVMDRLGMTQREILTLTDGDLLCMHVMERERWLSSHS